MRILINAIIAKKYAGGGFQICINFLLKTLEYKDVEWYYVTSQDLDDVVGSYFASLRGKRYFVFPTQPDFLHTYRKVRKEIGILERTINPHVVYSVLAPSYFSFKKPEVMRFANAWITNPNRYSKKVLSLKESVHIFLYRLIQKSLMRKARYFITQTELLKQGIIRITGLPDSHVRVVSNALPEAFDHQDNAHVGGQLGWIDVACVGVGSPHKNFDILPDVIVELQELGIKNVRFHTTIVESDRTWERMVKKLNKYQINTNIINHGRMTQVELGEVYRHCSLCYLPSLLETFSASSVEAMYFNLPTVATALQFNKEVFADSCLYCEPMNAKDAAIKFAILINNEKLRQQLIEKMQPRLAIYGDYDRHFNAIKNFLIEVAEENVQTFRDGL